VLNSIGSSTIVKHDGMMCFDSPYSVVNIMC